MLENAIYNLCEIAIRKLFKHLPGGTCNGGFLWGPSFAEEGKIVVTNEMIYQKLLEIEKRQYLRKDLLK